MRLTFLPKSAVLLAILPALVSSCTTIKKVNQAARTPVQFSNAKAADTFYRALIRNTTPHNDRNEVTVGIWVTPPYKFRRIDSDNVILNRAATRADTDGNRWITETEAMSYSKSTNKTVQS